MKQYINLIEGLKTDFIGGPKCLKLSWIVNAFKGCSFMFIIMLMHYFQRFDISAYIYLIIHGSYGIIWIIKDLSFPDQSWNVYITIPSLMGGAAILLAYWVIPIMQMINEPIDIKSQVIVIVIYIFGLTLVMVSDCQKYYTLKYRKGLINEGMFAYCRNPNYTGEMMIYYAFARSTGHLISYLIIITAWITIFLPLIIKKEYSFSQKPGYKAYAERSYIIFWKITDSHIVNAMIYLSIYYLVY